MDLCIAVNEYFVTTTAFTTLIQMDIHMLTKNYYSKMNTNLLFNVKERETESVCCLSFTPGEWTDGYRGGRLGSVYLTFLSHRYYMCPEATEKIRQMDSMEPAPVLTTHQLACDQSE